MFDHLVNLKIEFCLGFLLRFFNSFELSKGNIKFWLRALSWDHLFHKVVSKDLSLVLKVFSLWFKFLFLNALTPLQVINFLHLVLDVFIQIYIFKFKWLYFIWKLVVFLPQKWDLLGQFFCWIIYGLVLAGRNERQSWFLAVFFCIGLIRVQNLFIHIGDVSVYPFQFIALWTYCQIWSRTKGLVVHEL